MSEGNPPPEKEIILGIPYLSPTLDKETALNNNSSNPEPTTTNREDTEKNKKDNKKEKNIEKNKKNEENKKNDEKNEKSEKNKKNVSSGIPEQESSNSKIGLGINKRRASDAVEATTSKSVEALNLPNSNYLKEQQKELIILFLQHSRKIECEHCTFLGKLNITRIDDTEIGDIHDAEIIFTCRECKKKNEESKVQAQVLGTTKIKKRQVLEEEEDNVSEDKIMEEATIEDINSQSQNVETEQEFELKRNQLKCTHCENIGSINKNGHNQSKPRQRQYKCKNCNKSICMSEMKILLKYLNTDCEMEQVEESEFSDNDFPESDDENVMEIGDDEDVELVMDVRNTTNIPDTFSNTEYPKLQSVVKPQPQSQQQNTVGT
ncbi:hypothetical protein MFLAVUS_001056 [Mucor flavus]|uniref:Uncharacterized protein n=1 Tax=Mucor flavus TaxID=439312 RepID=A0ABP9YLE2_9FUNG